MKKLKLVFPCEGYADEWDAIIKEMEIETIDITPYSLKHRTSDYNEYLRIVRSFASGIDIPAGKVKAATYFLVEDTKKRILGAIDIRFDLNEYLYNYGGNIGYGIRPSERRKGYATKMLALALDVCRQSGLKRVLVTCDEDNIGSRRTIEKNGGVLENIVVCEGENVMRFWINLV